MLAYHCNSMIFTHRSRGSKRDFQPGTQLYKERTDFISLVRIKMKTAFDARKYSPEELNDLLGNQILVLPGLMQALYCLFDRMYIRFIYPKSSCSVKWNVRQEIAFCKLASFRLSLIEPHCFGVAPLHKTGPRQNHCV